MKAFNVFVKAIRDFHVILRDVSFVDSLVLIVKRGNVYIQSLLVEHLLLKPTISYKSKIIVAEWLDKFNPKVVIKGKSSIDGEISSDEYFSDAYINNLNRIRMNISNRECISSDIKSKLNIILNPTIGKFRKLIEFDNLILAELDGLTLEEMDYIEETLKDIL